MNSSLVFLAVNGLAEPIQTVNALKKHFNYSAFRLGQEEIIEKILDLKEFLAVITTSAGKSLLYQQPSLMRPDCALLPHQQARWLEEIELIASAMS